MNTGTFETHNPRTVSNLGLWKAGKVEYKVYGISAINRVITEQITNDALTFARNDVGPIVAAEGDSNALGFIIIHSGSLGVSISVHWWIQGSVLCQQIKRTLWNSDAPMDTKTRPVIACVWELELINAEQLIWRQTMMKSDPNPNSYLNTRIPFTHV